MGRENRKSEMSRVTRALAVVAVLLVLGSIGATGTADADDCSWQCFPSMMSNDYNCGAGGQWYCEYCDLVCPGVPENQIP